MLSPPTGPRKNTSQAARAGPKKPRPPLVVYADGAPRRPAHVDPAAAHVGKQGSVCGAGYRFARRRTDLTHNDLSTDAAERSPAETPGWTRCCSSARKRWSATYAGCVGAGAGRSGSSLRAPIPTAPPTWFRIGRSGWWSGTPKPADGIPPPPLNHSREDPPAPKRSGAPRGGPGTEARDPPAARSGRCRCVPAAQRRWYQTCPQAGPHGCRLIADTWGAPGRYRSSRSAPSAGASREISAAPGGAAPRPSWTSTDAATPGWPGGSGPWWHRSVPANGGVRSRHGAGANGAGAR